MLKNVECSSIIQVVGAGSGRTFDVDAARYGRIIFMADADSDGAHIRCLLATLFFRYMRELVDAGRVFTAVPPLHRIELSNPKKGQEQVRLHLFRRRAAAQARRAAAARTSGGRTRSSATRVSARWTPTQLAETTMDPRHRTLRRITVDDAEEAAAVFELLMGNEVAPRKEFIVQGAYELDADRDRRLTVRALRDRGSRGRTGPPGHR